MKTLIFILTITTIFAACHFKHNNISYSKTTDSCSYTLLDFVSANDSSKYILTKLTNMTEVSDKVKWEYVSQYIFDTNNVLRFYAFANTKTHSYKFGIDYDSLGHQIDTLKSTIVSWYVDRMVHDSVVITFYLYGINYSYKDIEVIEPNYTKKISLYYSDYFSNLIHGKDTLANPHKTIMIYVTGTIKNKCTQQAKEFIDSSSLIP